MYLAIIKSLLSHIILSILLLLSEMHISMSFLLSSLSTNPQHTYIIQDSARRDMHEPAQAGFKQLDIFCVRQLHLSLGS